MQIFHCVNCNTELIRQRIPQGIYWACPVCESKAATLPLLRRVMGGENLNRLWLRAKYEFGERKRNCPACFNGMVEVDVLPDPDILLVDVCTSCHFIWFDPQEHDRMSRLSVKSPLEIDREKWVEKMERSRRIGHRPTLMPVKLVDTEQMTAGGAADFLLGLAGLPVEENQPTVKCLPWMTWLLAAVCILVTLTMFGTDYGQLVNTYGFVSAEPLRQYGLTFITSFFLHGDLTHLLGNVYFLTVFGDNVEDTLGRPQYLLLILLATIMGDGLHATLDPRSTMPAIGASGGISGIMAFYALRFPRVKVALLFRFWLLFRWIRLSAGMAFVVWVGLQLVNAYSQYKGQGHVSSLAHLGGVLVGLGFWYVERARFPAGRSNSSGSGGIGVSLLV